MKTKTKKILLRLINLITLAFIVMNLITIFTGLGGMSKAVDFADSSWLEGIGSAGIYTLSIVAFHGIPFIIIMVLKLGLILVGFIGQLIMSGVMIGFQDGNASTGFVTLEDILFAGTNKGSSFLDVDFFNFSPSIGETTLAFRTSVAKWYYILRLISAAALLVILIYVGIRMALSTIGEEKARYKEMFVDWVESVALLFLLHYIIIFFIRVNSAFVKGLAGMSNDVTSTLFKDLIANVFLSALGGIVAAVIFCILVGQILKFFIIYMKRMITVGFLIMISPLITITYSIDKMGDKKAQALNAWMKELAYNILIQPFHCIIFLSFYSSLSTLMEQERFGLAPYIFAIIIINFMGKAEEILKHIFHFEARHMSSMAEAAQVVANANGAFMGIRKKCNEG